MMFLPLVQIHALLLQAWFDEGFDPLTTARKFMAVLISGLVSKPRVV